MINERMSFNRYNTFYVSRLMTTFSRVKTYGLENVRYYNLSTNAAECSTYVHKSKFIVFDIQSCKEDEIIF